MSEANNARALFFAVVRPSLSSVSSHSTPRLASSCTRAALFHTATPAYDLGSGDLVTMLRPDSGDGWVWVRTGDEREGYVPASFLSPL